MAELTLPPFGQPNTKTIVHWLRKLLRFIWECQLKKSVNAVMFDFASAKRSCNCQCSPNVGYHQSSCNVCRDRSHSLGQDVHCLVTERWKLRGSSKQPRNSKRVDKVVYWRMKNPWWLLTTSLKAAFFFARSFISFRLAATKKTFFNISIYANWVEALEKFWVNEPSIFVHCSPCQLFQALCRHIGEQKKTTWHRRHIERLTS